MRTILITGATGFLGSHLVEALLKEGDTRIIAVLGRPEDKGHVLPVGNDISIIPCSELFSSRFGHIDTVIHTAFSRGENLGGLTDSVFLTERIITQVNNGDIDSVINISSQAVYGAMDEGVRVSEDAELHPGTAYGFAKLCTEKMFGLGCNKAFTHVRMASLSKNARFLGIFVDKVIRGEEIKVTSPHRYASLMDVSDAVKGIIAIAFTPHSQRSRVYNLGPGNQYSILDLAYKANQIGQEFGCPKSFVTVEDDGCASAICMDCSKIADQIGWTCSTDMDDTLRKMFSERLNG